MVAEKQQVSLAEELSGSTCQQLRANMREAIGVPGRKLASSIVFRTKVLVSACLGQDLEKLHPRAEAAGLPQRRPISTQIWSNRTGASVSETRR